MKNMSDNPRRVIYRLGSLDEPSFVRYGNGELALLPPDAPHKFLCRYCLVHNNNVEESVYTGNTYYQRHGAKCNHYGRPADEVLSLQLMRELSLVRTYFATWLRQCTAMHCNGGIHAEPAGRQSCFLRKYLMTWTTKLDGLDLRCDAM